MNNLSHKVTFDAAEHVKVGDIYASTDDDGVQIIVKVVKQLDSNWNRYFEGQILMVSEIERSYFRIGEIHHCDRRYYKKLNK